jgi:hypothetical protein
MELRLAIERLKGPGGAVLQNDLQARHPIGLPCMD